LIIKIFDIGRCEQVEQFFKLFHLFSQTDYSVSGRGSERMSLARLFKANGIKFGR
jgi:hypothetical protein